MTVRRMLQSRYTGIQCSYRSDVLERCAHLCLRQVLPVTRACRIADIHECSMQAVHVRGCQCECQRYGRLGARCLVSEELGVGLDCHAKSTHPRTQSKTAQRDDGERPHCRCTAGAPRRDGSTGSRSRCLSVLIAVLEMHVSGGYFSHHHWACRHP